MTEQITEQALQGGLVGVPELGLGLEVGQVQWRAERFQLCNWGGFGGINEFSLDSDSTLLTGGSGTGKSTLLDAWLALVQPSGTAFNAASNPAKGRARGEGQRNMLSYMRGHIDKKVTDGGSKEDRKLRGHSASVWSAIAATFVSSNGERHSIFRLMHAMPSHRIDSEATVRLCSVPGRLDIKRLESAAPDRFSTAAIKRVVPGVTVHPGPQDFQEKFAARLGIGTGTGPGSGSQKALRMLERIQSGQPVPNVNELFTRYVLEEPATIRDADKALTEWDRLEDTAVVIEVNRAKHEVLRDMRSVHEQVEQSARQRSAYSDLGLDEQTSPWALWCARHEERILDDAAETNRTRRELASLEVSAAETTELQAQTAKVVAEKNFNDYSRGELDGLKVQASQADTELAEAVQRRASLAAVIAVLGDLPESRERFEAIRGEAFDQRNTYTASKEHLEAKDARVQREQFELSDEKARLMRDRESYGRRQGRVTPDMDDVRAQAALVAGMDPSALPYAAELLDIADGQGEWREAIETILWPIASCILLDEERLEEFSAAVDNAGLRRRINFEGVALYRMSRADPDADHVSGKVVHKDSPFEGWLRDRLARNDLNAMCVRTPDQLRSHDQREVRVTIAGQTRRAQRGSAGKRGRAHIIGFSNEDAVATVDKQIADLVPQLNAVAERHNTLRKEIDGLTDRNEAAGHLVLAEWASLDVAAIEERRNWLFAKIDELTSSDSTLAQLDREKDQAQTEWLAARDLAHDARTEAANASKEHREFVDRQDRLTPRIERLEQAGVALTPKQDELLTRSLTQSLPTAEVDWRTITQVHRWMRNALESQARLVTSEATAAQQALIGVFSKYLSHWGEQHPALDASIDSYPDFLAILEEIEGFGLHEAAAKFRASLVNWSGQQLLRLNGAFDTARDEIEERMDAINDILRRQAFGAQNETLHIRVDRRQSMEVTDFRRGLQSLAMRRTEELPESEVMIYFRAARALLARIRRPDDPRAQQVPGAPSRAALLDVRRHIVIEADRIDASGAVVGTYDTLGTQSGGEGQELLAFILGAALRYQLGDQERDRPTFAFVVLDEAFVKADPEFAGRSMKLWQSLGFQMLVATPVDKFTALEPYAQKFLLTEKDEEHRSYLGSIDRVEALVYAEEATLRGDHLDDGTDESDSGPEAGGSVDGAAG
jgi:uncharacterized protein YPO0396